MRTVLIAAGAVLVACPRPAGGRIAHGRVRCEPADAEQRLRPPEQRGRRSRGDLRHLGVQGLGARPGDGPAGLCRDDLRGGARPQSRRASGAGTAPVPRQGDARQDRRPRRDRGAGTDGRPGDRGHAALGGHGGRAGPRRPRRRDRADGMRARDVRRPAAGAGDDPGQPGSGECPGRGGPGHVRQRARPERRAARGGAPPRADRAPPPDRPAGRGRRLGPGHPRDRGHAPLPVTRDRPARRGRGGRPDPPGSPASTWSSPQAGRTTSTSPSTSW